MFSVRLAELRKKKGFTQAQFAKEFNVATGTIGMWESRKREPNFETMQRLADFFDVSVDYLLGRDKSEEPKNIVFAYNLKPGETIDEEEQQQVNEYIEFIMSKRRKK